MKMESEVTPVSNDFMATHCVLNSSATEWSAPDRADANDVYSVERFLATPIVQHLFSVSILFFRLLFTPFISDEVVELT